ncbi:hypothetical protein KI387_003420, partial [Taxus chinensis]
TSIKREKNTAIISNVIVRPAVPDNNISWQVFENDQQIVNFLQEEAEVLQLRIRIRLAAAVWGSSSAAADKQASQKVSVMLESIFNPNDLVPVRRKDNIS